MADLTPPDRSTLAYLGPQGTFTEQALYTQPDLAGLDLRPVPSIPDVFRQVVAGQVDLAFAAIENSIEGSVNITQDTLAFDVDLLIQREVVISIQLNLMVAAGTTLFLIPVMVFTILLRKHLLRGITFGAVRK